MTPAQFVDRYPEDLAGFRLSTIGDMRILCFFGHPVPGTPSDASPVYSVWLSAATDHLDPESAIFEPALKAIRLQAETMRPVPMTPAEFVAKYPRDLVDATIRETPGGRYLEFWTHDGGARGTYLPEPGHATLLKPEVNYYLRVLEGIRDGGAADRAWMAANYGGPESGGPIVETSHGPMPLDQLPPGSYVRFDNIA